MAEHLAYEETNTDNDSSGMVEIELSKERILAAARAACILITTVAAYWGYAWDADQIYQVVTTVLAIAAVVWGYWKNNNWTEFAASAQQVLNTLKSENK